MTEGTPHTAGPWEVSSGDIWAVSPWNARVKIASVTRFASMNGINADANARLIATSPDLLEALKGLVRINEQHNEAISKIIGRPFGWKDEYLTAARAAIAKAEGGAL